MHPAHAFYILLAILIGVAYGFHRATRHRSWQEQNAIILTHAPRVLFLCGLVWIALYFFFS